MSYRRRATPLHAAGPAAGIAYCASLGVAALVLDHPLALVGVIVALVAAGAAAGALPAFRRVAPLAAVLSVTIVAINALLTRDGLTVILRLGDLPLLGHTDVTLEAVVYGSVLALRAVALILCGALYTAAVDPDEVLRLLRPLSFRSALSATIATRMVPVLLRDSRRMAEAQRCRPGAPPSRLALMRAATAGMLDRALDVAAVLEVRGFGAARRPSGSRRPWGRHAYGFLAAGLAITALIIAARAGGLSVFHAYPQLQASGPGSNVSVALGVVLLSLLPFCDRRGVAG